MKWKPWESSECPHCGSALEVLTEETRDGYAFDGDEVRCVSCRCPGAISVDDNYEDDMTAWANMHDDPECECDWCKMRQAQNDVSNLRDIVREYRADHDRTYHQGRACECEICKRADKEVPRG